MKWQDTKMSKLEYYVANINPNIQGKNITMYPIVSHYPHEPLSSQRTLKLLQARSDKLGVEVASSPKYEDMKDMQ